MPPKSLEWLLKHKRVAEMLNKDDWVSVWVGLATFLLTLPFAANGEPLVWDGRLSDGALMGVVTLLLLMVAPLVVMGSRFIKTEEVLPGFAFMFILAVAGKVIGGQATMKQAGLGATVWTLVLGMLLSNVVARFTSIQVILPAAKLAEFFIKIGLVLLAIELSTLGQYGVAGLLVAWCVTPVCVAVIYSIGTRLIAPDCSRSLVCLLAAGISVCGGSAITATASAIKVSRRERESERASERERERKSARSRESGLEGGGKTGRERGRESVRTREGGRAGRRRGDGETESNASVCES